jgi:DNA polymerase-3 subunit alpha
MSEYVSLHTHTQMSFLDGYQSVEGLVKRAVDLGQTAVAVTDHQECSAHLRLQKAADKHGIKGIYGMEGYLTHDVAESRELKHKPSNFSHVTFLAQNEKGLRNLWGLSSSAYTDNFYHRALTDWRHAREYVEGLYATDGCLLSFIAQAIIADDEQAQHELMGRYLDTFQDNFRMELHTWQFVDPSDESQRELNENMTKVNQRKVDLAHQYGVPLIVVNDAHYSTPDEWENHALVWEMSTGSNSDKTDRGQTASWVMEDKDLYYWMDKHGVSAEVVREAIAETKRIADNCNVRIEAEVKMPHFSKSSQEDAKILIRKVEEGFRRKVEQAGLDTDLYHERVMEEMRLIVSKDFAGYFNVVEDYVNHAKNELDIFVGPGRGSAGGSLVAYLLDITGVDPLEHNLLFERFLSPDRAGFPDIDMDFQKSRLGDIKQYMADRYGGDHVCGIGTLSESGPKGILKDLGRAMGVSFGDSDAISKIIGNDGSDWHELMKVKSEEFAPYKEKYPDLFKKASEMVGMIRQSSTHASGFLVSSDPLLGDLPLRKKNDTIVSAFDMNEVEELGFVKFDFLGIRHNDTIKHCLDLIEKRHGKKIDLYSFREEFDDVAVWEPVWKGDTIGLFQLEANLMTETAKDFRPATMRECALLLAANRPGVMAAGQLRPLIDRKHGRQDVTYDHPMLEEFLDETFGIIVYQEQMMRIARKIAGFTGAESDWLREVIGKKKLEQIPIVKEKFYSGTLANEEFVSGCQGPPEDTIDKIWRSFEASGSYAFNKAHAVEYAIVSAWEAWLKYYYTPEFVAALMTSDPGGVPRYVRYARKRGLEVLPPDVNESGPLFSISDVGIRYGLSSVRNIGWEAAKEIERNAPFTSLDDFMDRVPKRKVNRTAIHHLIMVGAFDSLEPDRAMLQSKFYAKVKMAEDKQRPLFDPSEIKRNFETERELIGTGVLYDPMRPYADLVERACLETPDEVEDLIKGEVARVGGLVNSVRAIRTKAGKPMGFLKLEWLGNEFDVTVFPEAWAQFRPLLKENTPVVCRIARLDRGCHMTAVERLDLMEED